MLGVAEGRVVVRSAGVVRRIAGGERELLVRRSPELAQGPVAPARPPIKHGARARPQGA